MYNWTPRCPGFHSSGPPYGQHIFYHWLCIDYKWAFDVMDNLIWFIDLAASNSCVTLTLSGKENTTKFIISTNAHAFTLVFLSTNVFFVVDFFNVRQLLVFQCCATF